MNDVAPDLRAEAERLRLRLKESDARTHEFVARLAHELRTPLGAILMWAHVLRMGNDADRPAALDAIDISARAQGKMIGNLLDVSRGLAGRLRIESLPLDLREPVRFAADSMKPAARARAINLQVSLGSGDFPILGDSNRLSDTVASLLDNAIKFTPDEGAVTLELVQREENAHVIVRDSGRGLTGEDLAEIFTPFHVVGEAKTRPVGGLGVSLILARLTAQLHGGTITADSEGLGRGTTFTLELPLRQDEGA